MEKCEVSDWHSSFRDEIVGNDDDALMMELVGRPAALPMPVLPPHSL